MSTRTRLTAAEVKAKWMSDDATGLIHDHRSDEVVVTMVDGSEFACSFAEHTALLAEDDS